MSRRPVDSVHTVISALSLNKSINNIMDTANGEYFTRSTFRTMVATLITTASEKGVSISDADIIEKLNIGEKEYKAYLSEELMAPEALIHSLRNQYSAYIGDLLYKKITHTFTHYVVNPPTPPRRDDMPDSN